jgi:hypothetical protein
MAEQRGRQSCSGSLLRPSKSKYRRFATRLNTAEAPRAKSATVGAPSLRLVHDRCATTKSLSSAIRTSSSRKKGDYTTIFTRPATATNHPFTSRLTHISTFENTLFHLIPILRGLFFQPLGRRHDSVGRKPFPDAKAVHEAVSRHPTREPDRLCRRRRAETYTADRNWC